MMALALAAFVAMTGLHAGPIFCAALAEPAIGLFWGGVLVTMVPLVVGLYVGRYGLRMNPALLLDGLRARCPRLERVRADAGTLAHQVRDAALAVIRLATIRRIARTRGLSRRALRLEVLDSMVGQAGFEPTTPSPPD